MYWLRLAGLALLVGVVVVLVGAAAQQPTKPAPAPPSTPTPPPTPEDPAAKSAFEAALKNLANLSWIDTTLFQQMDVQGLFLQSEGSYRAGPGHRLRMNLKVHVGDTTGKLDIVCDGTTFWEVLQLGDSAPKSIRKLEFKKVLDALNNPTMKPQVRDEFLHNQTFAGVLPLMQSLQQRLTFTGIEKNVPCNGRNCTKLSAVWAQYITNSITSTERPAWPAFLPRQCRIYLDAQTSWPHRIEWWGPSPPRTGDALLLVMEYRNPKLNVPMTPEQCAKIFTLDPGKGEVPDHTKETIQALNERSRQMSQTK